MTNLLPDQVRLLFTVLQSKDILIAAALSLTRADASEWLEACSTLIVEHSTALRGKHYALALNVGTKSNTTTKLQHLLSATASNNGCVISLDLKGRFISTVSGAVTISGSIERTKKAGSLELIVHGTYTYTVLAGEVLSECDALDVAKPPPAGIAFYRPTKQLREIVLDHAGQELARETGVKYWADKRLRILLAAPETTEKIFQRSLLSWLRHYVVDKIRIYSETRGFGQDATDITVMTGHGDYVLEVKWMGQNQSHTKYDESQIAVGLSQVGQYLDNDPRLVTGAVVVYDGRQDPSVQPIDPQSLHGRCEMPYVVWLENETPSKIAAASVRAKGGNSPKGRKQIAPKGSR